MAGVTERDREAANRLFFLCGSLGDFDAACAFLAEWREARMAESEAARQTMAVAMQEAIDREVDARLKAEGERDTVAKRLEFFLSVDTAGSGWCGEHPRMYSMRPGEEADGECLACQVEAAEARLRAVIEALRAVHGECPGWIEVCGSAHDPRCDGTCAVGCPVPVQEQEKCQVCDLLGRDAQASPEPHVFHNRLDEQQRKEGEQEPCALCGRMLDAAIHASPEPEASKQAGHEFKSHPVLGSLLCMTCGLPWSQHGGRDGE